jgi:hypothetical protein
MLNNSPFYFSVIRKMTAAFGTLFNDIIIPRYDANNAVNQLVRVPISYGPKEKWTRIIDDPEFAKQSAVSPLPRISFEMRAPFYDATRSINPTQAGMVQPDPTTGDMKRQFVPVPYNFPFDLWVYAKTIEDGNKIVEQILPFFRPEFPLKIELIAETGTTINVPVVLNSADMNDSYEGNFDQRRAIIWSFRFTMKGYLYGPITQDKVIKFANVNFYAPTIVNLVDAVGNSSPIDRITSQPGLTANGEPTSNISLTIPYTEIEQDDNWAYINIIYGNLDPSEGTGGDQANNLPFPTP